ncbi:MAG: protein phosphatase CheZ [Betaproteobacteria bacterium]|nr:protein phosphatase CheZ [Betaproteobacteria bacterium]
MTKRFKFDESGDSADLQALFDNMAGQTLPRTAPAAPRERHVAVVGSTATVGDSLELEALFDSVASEAAQPAPPAANGSEEGDAPHAGDNVFQRIGHMTRQLHDTLRQLGYDRALEEAAKAIPDAKQRLAYVAQLTEQAASRVLNATDVARPIQDKLQGQAAALSGRWDRLYDGDLSVDEFKALSADTRAFLGDVPQQTEATNAQLMEIMMAQDFQDLTGQVIKKIVDLAQSMESELLQVLIEAMPEEMKTEKSDGLLNGPVMNAQGRSDVVTNQEQVDDLLESLGF